MGKVLAIATHVIVNIEIILELVQLVILLVMSVLNQQQMIVKNVLMVIITTMVNVYHHVQINIFLIQLTPQIPSAMIVMKFDDWLTDYRRLMELEGRFGDES